MDTDSQRIVFDGKILPGDQPVIPAGSRGLMYGDGVFETFRAFSSQTFLLDRHLSRLKKGLKTLGITLPSFVKKEKLKPLIFELLQENDLSKQDAIIRLQVWRDGNRGYLPEKRTQPHFAITASRCPKNFDFTKLVSVSTKRIPSQALPSDCKFTNGINYILAAREAAEKGGDDALMQTVDGLLSETTIANIFWIKNRKIFTPSTDCDLIPGITRHVILDLIKTESLEVNEGEFQLKHILDADAAWICNSVRELLPVKQIDGHVLDVNNKLLAELKHRFGNFRDENLNSLQS